MVPENKRNLRKVGLSFLAGGFPPPGRLFLFFAEAEKETGASPAPWRGDARFFSLQGLRSVTGGGYPLTADTVIGRVDRALLA